MEVQCFEMWGKVKIEKLQNDPSLVSHSIFSVLMKEFFNVSLVVVHSNLNINMDSNKRVHKQTNNNKQTNMYGHLKRGLKPLISQNINHNKDTNEVAGAWFAWIFMLIVTGIFDFINVHWFHWPWSGLSIGWTTQEPAPPPGTTSSCCWADQLRTKDITPHKGTCSLLTSFVHFATFQLRPYPIFWNTALSPMA